MQFLRKLSIFLFQICRSFFSNCSQFQVRKYDTNSQKFIHVKSSNTFASIMSINIVQDINIVNLLPSARTSSTFLQYSRTRNDIYVWMYVYLRKYPRKYLLDLSSQVDCRYCAACNLLRFKNYSDVFPRKFTCPFSFFFFLCCI